MALIELMKDAGEMFVLGASQSATARAAPDLAADVDPVPIGDPDEDEGQDDEDEDDDDEEEEEEEEPLQLHEACGAIATLGAALSGPATRARK